MYVYCLCQSPTASVGGPLPSNCCSPPTSSARSSGSDEGKRPACCRDKDSKTKHVRAFVDSLTGGTQCRR